MGVASVRGLCVQRADVDRCGRHGGGARAAKMGVAMASGVFRVVMNVGAARCARREKSGAKAGGGRRRVIW
jgi:hypothetical protein